MCFEISEINNEMRRKTFEDLGISSWLINSLGRFEINKPTLIQQACIPESLKGKDIIGMSETGTGKTASFGKRWCPTLPWTTCVKRIL